MWEGEIQLHSSRSSGVYSLVMNNVWDMAEPTSASLSGGV